MFEGKAARLRALRIVNEIEIRSHPICRCRQRRLISARDRDVVIAYVVGLPSPALWGVVAFLLNYIPYVGPAIVAMILLVLGIISLPTLPAALVGAGAVCWFCTVEGHFITPSLVGRQLTLSPLALFLSLAFWTWLWGPLGTFLATPILIAVSVIENRMVADEDKKLPG